MEVIPNILFGKVMHKRLSPKVNAFNYGIYYFSLPLSQIDRIPIPRNRFGMLSFYDKDHGYRDGRPLRPWAEGILSQYGISKATGEIVLVTLPRVLGYVFNPVSFWLCLDKKKQPRAVIVEVNNTFGESHTYLCAHTDQRPIRTDDWFEGDKLFHVSPFLKREGHYAFRFDLRANAYAIWINYYTASGKKQLLTSLAGKISPMNKASLRRAFFAYPLVTLKAITLIHYQALKLIAKGIQHIRKPEQGAKRISASRNLTES